MWIMIAAAYTSTNKIEQCSMRATETMLTLYSPLVRCFAQHSILRQETEWRQSDRVQRQSARTKDYTKMSGEELSLDDNRKRTIFFATGTMLRDITAKTSNRLPPLMA